MKALISGQAGIAVLIEGKEYTSIEVDSMEAVRRAEHDVPFLVGDASDLIELDGTSKDEAARKLKSAWLKDRSIHLSLIALDCEAASRNRQSAVECLSDLLSELSVADFVRNRLYAAPLPPSADLSRTLDLAESCGSTKFASILKEVRTAQEPIRRNRLAWDALRPDLFGGVAEKERFGFVAVESGMFRLLALGQSGMPADWSSVGGRSTGWLRGPISQSEVAMRRRGDFLRRSPDRHGRLLPQSLACFWQRS